MTKLNKAFIVLLVLVSANTVLAGDAASAESGIKKSQIKIAAGSILEGEYTIALRLCRYFTRANLGLSCDVVPTSGSLENIGLLKNGSVDFAFSQGSLALDAYEAKGYFVESQPFKEMAQLLNIHDEVLTVIAKDRDKITQFAQIDGKRISNGPKNSDSAIMYVALSSYYDFKKEPVDIELTHEKYSTNLCNGNIDVIIMMTAHPNALVNHITHACETDFVDLEDDKIEQMIKNNAAYRKHVVDLTSYPGINRTMSSVAAPMIFVAHKSVPKEIVVNFMKYFESRVDQFKDSDPILYDLTNDHFTSGYILPKFDY